MYLDRLIVENVRGFNTGPGRIALDFARVDGSHAGWTVLAGRNGSGKTTLIRAIALALVGPGIARSLMPDFEEWISQGERAALVQAAFTVGEGDAMGAVGAPPKRRAWAGLAWELTSDGPVPALSESIPASSPKQTARRGPWSENPIGWFIAGYGPFRRLTGAAAEAQRLMLGNKRTSALVTLFDESASLAESIWWLQELYPRVLEGDENAGQLMRDVIELLNDGLLPDGSKVEHYDSRGLWIRQGNVRTVLDQMSDGYRVVSALVLDIVRRIYASTGSFDLNRDDDGRLVSSHEGVVLIDEIDVHLHVSWQQQIGFWLTEHFPRMQFLVSTHSPFICQAASANGLLRLPAPDEMDRSPRFLDDDTFNLVVNGGADRAVMSELFGLESTYSERTLRRREEWKKRAISHDAGKLNLDELSGARKELGLGPTAEIEIALASLDEAIRDLHA